MRADEAAVAALDAQVGVPDRDQLGDVALLVLGRAARVGAVDRQRADRQLVAAAGHHRRGHGAHELRRLRGHHRRGLARRRDPVGQLTRCRASSAWSTAAGCAHHLGAAPAVGLGDRRLDPLDRRRGGRTPDEREEAGLQHRVGPPAETRLAGDPAGVDHIQLEPLGEDLLLHRARQRVPHLVRRQVGVEQQRRPRRGPVEHLGALEQPELVAADEVRLEIRYGALIGSGPKRRCETVCEPDFFES